MVTQPCWLLEAIPLPLIQNALADKRWLYLEVRPINRRALGEAESQDGASADKVAGQFC